MLARTCLHLHTYPPECLHVWACLQTYLHMPTCVCVATQVRMPARTHSYMLPRVGDTAGREATRHSGALRASERHLQELAQVPDSRTRPAPAQRQRAASALPADLPADLGGGGTLNAPGGAAHLAGRADGLDGAVLEAPGHAVVSARGCPGRAAVGGDLRARRLLRGAGGAWGRAPSPGHPCPEVLTFPSPSPFPLTGPSSPHTQPSSLPQRQANSKTTCRRHAPQQRRRQGCHLQQWVSFARLAGLRG